MADSRAAAVGDDVPRFPKSDIHSVCKEEYRPNPGLRCASRVGPFADVYLVSQSYNLVDIWHGHIMIRI